MGRITRCEGELGELVVRQLCGWICGFRIRSARALGGVGVLRRANPVFERGFDGYIGIF
jgi:hypothetical protein